MCGGGGFLPYTPINLDVIRVLRESLAVTFSPLSPSVGKDFGSAVALHKAPTPCDVLWRRSR